MSGKALSCSAGRRNKPRCKRLAAVTRVMGAFYQASQKLYFSAPNLVTAARRKCS